MELVLSHLVPRSRVALLAALALSLSLFGDAATTMAASDAKRPARATAAKAAGWSGGDGASSVRGRVALGVTMRGGGISDLDGFSAAVGGRRPALWSVSVKWGSDKEREFPSALARQLAARRVVPFVWWTPTSPGGRGDHSFRYERIAAGDHDAYIRRFARDAKAYGRLVLLRFAHEFNGRYFRWAVDGPIGHDVRAFKKAWRHIWRIFKQAGATNVRFVWSVVKKRCEGCNPYRKFYPGDRFVDYLGFSSYNWGPSMGRPWKGMARTYRHVVRRLREVADKPIIVSETGTSHVGGAKAAWIARGYRKVFRKYPRIVAIVYTNVDLRYIGHPDWSLTTRRASLDAYAKIAALPAFSGRLTLANTRPRAGGTRARRVSRK